MRRKTGYGSGHRNLACDNAKNVRKPCRHGLSYGNLKSTVFPLGWAVTCTSRLPAALHQKNLQHTTYKAFGEAELNPYGRFDLEMNSRLALLDRFGGW